jgi:hypothetical protein
MIIDSPETENAQTNTRQELVAKIKFQKALINQLVSVIEEANEMLLDAAATSGEADKILSASKVLVHGVAGVAKA